MNYSIKVKSQDGQEKITEINGSGKVAVNSADQINFSSSAKYENMIILRKGKDLKILLENGDVLTFTDFYNSAVASSLEFVDADGGSRTILSTDTSMTLMGDGSFLVFAQGDHSVLISMSDGNNFLSDLLISQNDISADGSSNMGLVYGGLSVLGIAAAASSTKGAAVAQSVAPVELSGTYATVQTAITPGGMSANATVSDTITVAQANTIDTQITGTLTATLAAGTLSSFASLTGTGNALTMTVSDTGSIAAATLNTLAGKTTATVTAVAATGITGTAADIATSLSSSIISHSASGITATISDTGSVAAADLNTIDTNSANAVVASSATAISGTAAAIATALTSTGITDAVGIVATFMLEAQQQQT